MFVRLKFLGAIGLLVLILVAVAGLSAPLVAPFSPTMVESDRVFLAPGWPHLLGTDEFGRDVLSRIIFGARVSLGVSLAALAVSVAGGSVIGLLSGYFMGRLDLFLQRCIDTIMAFPGLILALALVATLGTSVLNVIIAISVVFTPRIARVVRASTIETKGFQYIESARSIGASPARVLARHIFPNILAPLIIIATANLGQAILLEASMSFLGLGVPPPEPSWGNMLTGASRDYAEQAPWMVVAPGMAITSTALGFNLFGDALRDFLDPRLKTV
ncbi:MAG: ABC transporter permease [Chloroflexi bacterium]|nr:ABC transporter permease [Chloroflexota bacterium]